MIPLLLYAKYVLQKHAIQYRVQQSISFLMIKRFIAFPTKRYFICNVIPYLNCISCVRNAKNVGEKIIEKFW